MEKAKPIFFAPSHKTILRVPLYEVDVGGGVYHGNYFHLFEVGRDDLFRSLGFPYRRLMDGGMHLTVAQLSCAYFKALHYDEEVSVVTGIRELRSRSIHVIQRIDRMGESGDNGEVGDAVPCVQAEFALVCVGAGNRVLSLPGEFRQALERWLSGVASGTP